MSKYQIGIIALAALSACAVAEPEGSEGAEAQAPFAASLAAEFPTDEKLDRPGYILQINQNGENLFEATSGAADIEQGRSIDNQTVFHIASLSKQITAAALAHAILDELVSLDDPVSRWIPETAKYGDALTVAHLVYLTSGLTEYYDQPGPGGRPWATFHYFTVDDAISASLAVDELRFEPGSAWQYNNINYMLIAAIVSEAYQRPFSQIVSDRIFEPLGMSASLINDDVTTIIPNRANGYAERKDEVLSNLREGAGIEVRDGPGFIMIRRNAPHYGGSGVMTSMSDWMLWQRELLSHDIFGDEFWDLMVSRRTFEHDKTNDAFGLVHGTHADRNTLWYAGGDIDTSTYTVTFPADGLSVTCFSNDPMDSCETKVRNAIDILEKQGAL